jgi:hypothetical protein
LTHAVRTVHRSQQQLPWIRQRGGEAMDEDIRREIAWIDDEKGFADFPDFHLAAVGLRRDSRRPGAGGARSASRELLSAGTGKERQLRTGGRGPRLLSAGAGEEGELLTAISDVDA